jgi:hypothetical protein
MGRAGRRLIGLVLLIVGALFGLYGLFAILYGGDNGGGGDTYVKFGRHRIDAGLVGAVSLLLALFAIFMSMVYLKPERR